MSLMNYKSKKLKGGIVLKELVLSILDAKKKQVRNRIVVFCVISGLSFFGFIPDLFGYLAVVMLMASLAFYMVELRLYQTVVLEVVILPELDGVNISLLNGDKLTLKYDYLLNLHANGDLALMDLNSKQFAWVFRDGIIDKLFYNSLKEFVNSDTKFIWLPNVDFERRRKIPFY